MSRTTIPVLVAAHPDGGAILRAPKVGLWSAHPRNGTLVGAGSSVGNLTQLRRRYVLAVPEGVSGRVAIEERPYDGMPVGYGETLLRVVPFAPVAAEHDAGLAGAPDETMGGLAILAPTDGVFYRAPSTGSRPYVLVGDRVVTGQPVGLIEVMKTFNPIAYGGAELPDRAEIVDVLVADESEVRVGQPLLIVKRL
jgi:biotin carboxyl carrier protein